MASWDHESLGDEFSASVELDNVQDFGPINEDDEYKHEFGYFLIVLLRGDSVGREMKRNTFTIALIDLFVGFPLFIMSAVADARYRSTPYFRPAHYGAPLLSLMYVVSFFALFFGLLCGLAVHHWASLVSNRELLGKLSRGLQGVMITQIAFDIWLLCVLYSVFEGVDYSQSFLTQEILILVVMIWLITIPHVILTAYYVLNVNYLQEQVDEGADIDEPIIPDHAMDLEGVYIIDLLGLLFIIPFIIIGVIKDFFSEIYEIIAKCWRNHKINSKRAARQRRSMWRRLSKTCVRMFRDATGLTKKPDHEMGYEDPTILNEEEAAAARLQLAEEARAQADIDREAREEEERLRKEQEEEEANELANAKVLNVKQFRQMWNDLPPAGSFSCGLKERPVMKTLVDHMETQGFFVVFASSTGRGLEDEDDFEIGVSNMKGQDFADNAKSSFRGVKIVVFIN